jgi:hypothetical protein
MTEASSFCSAICFFRWVHFQRKRRPCHLLLALGPLPAQTPAVQAHRIHRPRQQAHELVEESAALVFAQG